MAYVYPGQNMWILSGKIEANIMDNSSPLTTEGTQTHTFRKVYLCIICVLFGTVFDCPVQHGRLVFNQKHFLVTTILYLIEPYD